MGEAKQKPGQALTAKQKRELAAVSALPDEQIDTSDIPELPPSAWKDAVRGRFYRPVKQAISLRLDADVVAWLKKRGNGYQTRANHILRESGCCLSCERPAPDKPDAISAGGHETHFGVTGRSHIRMSLPPRSGSLTLA